MFFISVNKKKKRNVQVKTATIIFITKVVCIVILQHALKRNMLFVHAKHPYEQHVGKPTYTYIYIHKYTGKIDRKEIHLPLLLLCDYTRAQYEQLTESK